MHSCVTVPKLLLASFPSLPPLPALCCPLRMLKARPLLLLWSRARPEDYNKEGLS